MKNIERTRAILTAMSEHVQGVAIEPTARDVVGSTWHDVATIDGKLRLDWIEAIPADLEAVDAQLAAIVATAAKQKEVAQAYAAAIAAGYDTGLGFSLKLGEEDQRLLFDYQQRLLRQLDQASPSITPTDIKVVKGTDNAWHLATVEQIIEAIDGGAGHVESLNGAYAGYEAMLAAGVVEFEVAF